MIEKAKQSPINHLLKSYEPKSLSFVDNPGEKVIGCLKAKMRASLSKIQEDDKELNKS